ncbi:hypothetical protein SUGI_0707680 [Cryptomeria japonica]|nr:hypothetical protein SUGI_0707680 [Cryptomeria japonica]
MMSVVHVQEDDPLAVLNSFKASLQVNFSDLPKETKSEIEEEVRRLKPRCPNCLSKDCKYRYLNNKGRSKSLQPRFLCRSCHTQFTLGGKRYNSKLLSSYYNSVSLLQNAQTLNNNNDNYSESFIQVSKESVFENTHRVKKNNNQGLELHEDNKFNAAIADNLYDQTDNLYTPCLDNNISVPDLAWAQMGTANSQSNSEQVSLNVDGAYRNQLNSCVKEVPYGSYRNQLNSSVKEVSYGSYRNQLNASVKGGPYGIGMAEQSWNNYRNQLNASVKGGPYGIGMAEQSWNNPYSSLPFNSHNTTLGKSCMHNYLGCNCLRPILETPIASGGEAMAMDNSFQKQMVPHFWEENPLF